MKNVLSAGWIVILCVVLGHSQAANRQPKSAKPVTQPVAAGPIQRALVDQYCIGCHNERVKTAGLMLDRMDMSHVGDNAEVWEKVVRKLRAGMMPPPGSRRPDAAAYEGLTQWLENELDRAAAGKPPAGAPGLHRVNRTEYANAVRDLLALDFDARALLPVDDAGYGFDNMAGSLGVSPALIEAYVSAAAKISRVAVGNETAPEEKLYIAPPDYTQDQHVDGLPLGTRGGMLARHYFPADGEYRIRIFPLRSNTGVLFGSGMKGEKLEISLDGERIGLIDFDKEDAATDQNAEANKINEVRVPVKAGSHIMGAAFLATHYAPITNDLNDHFLRSTLDTGGVPGFTDFPHVSSILITGPYGATPAPDTPSRRQIFTCHPASANEELACAKQIISTLSRRAYRRPTTDDDLEVLMGFYGVGRNDGGFEGGVEMALRRILASPEFIFRIEAEPANVTPGQLYRISDLELASRLSFFLWSTNPDDELINLASKGKLRDPRTLEQQVRRMLADSRAHELVTNFAGQWLQLRNLQSFTPTAQGFPDFDDNLRQAFRTETEMFFESIMREDRAVTDLLTADYTFVNQRLARHYGIPNVYGEQFRRVTFAGDNPRRGLGILGHGSVLSVTSLATRTSPVHRGKWVLINLLGTIPPDPPPNVPPLNESDKTANGQTVVEAVSMRQRMEEHRANPACASCHKLMDPIGFSLENFDATGEWRTREGASTIDTSVELFDGSKIDGPARLREGLLRYSPQFVRTLTEKLLTYALGRGVEYSDMPTVRSIVRDAAAGNYRFSALVMGIVKSQPFQLKVKTQQSTVEK